MWIRGMFAIYVDIEIMKRLARKYDQDIFKALFVVVCVVCDVNSVDRPGHRAAHYQYRYRTRGNS